MSHWEVSGMMDSVDGRTVWRERVTAFRASGMSVAAWCREHGVKDHVMRYRIRQVEREERGSGPVTTQWLPLVEEYPAVGEALIVRIGQLAIEVRPGFDRDLLADVVKVLSARC